MHIVCQGFVTQRVAPLGVRRNIDYVGRKNYRNAYRITCLDAASGHRSRLDRHRWSRIWLECFFEARCHSAVGRHAVENYATGCTARHVLPKGPPCSGRKGQHGSTRRPEGCHRRSEEHTSELQSHLNLVCRLLLEKKKTAVKSKEIYRKETP